jgi:hypothetical protein
MADKTDPGVASQDMLLEHLAVAVGEQLVEEIGHCNKLPSNSRRA